MCIENAVLTVTSKRDEMYLYQTIRITPSNRSHTRYFFQDKYKAAREIDSLLRQLYLGDGVDIFFVEKQKFRNQIILKYRFENQVDVDLSERKFYIKATIPKYDGCTACNHLRPDRKSTRLNSSH